MTHTLKERLLATLMNAKINASEPGFYPPGDSHSRAFKPPQRPRAEHEQPASLPGDQLTIEAPSSRYAAGENVGKPDLANAISLSQTQEGFLQMV